MENNPALALQLFALAFECIQRMAPGTSRK